MKLIGWIVIAKDEDGKLVSVSAPFETEFGAQRYKEMYLKSYPESEAFVQQKTAEERN